MATTTSAFRCRLRKLILTGVAVATLASASPVAASLPGGTASSSPANLLFKSGFQPPTTVGAAYQSGVWWRDMSGSDAAGYSWPIRIWPNQTVSSFQMLIPQNVDVTKYMTVRTDRVTGHDGQDTNALYTDMHNSYSGPDQVAAYTSGSLDDRDLYTRYWLKLQPDLVQNLGPNNWRSIWAMKTADDYRYEAYIYTDSAGKPYWYVHGDNNPYTDNHPGAPHVEYWSVTNKVVPVPVGQWFAVEFFWHRSTGSDGRVFWAVNGQTVADYHGPNKINLAVNRYMPFMIYGGTHSGGQSVYQWVDDLEVRDGFPCDSPPCGGAQPPADTTPPTVTSTSPLSGATNVATGSSSAATFSEATQASTVNNNNFTLTGPDGQVAGTVSYNSNTRTATLTPSSQLANSTTYTATVSGVQDLAGNTMSPVSWSFTTARSPTCTACKIWAATTTPTVAADPDTGAVELGVKFRSDVAGYIKGIRFYKGSTNTGTHTAHLWSSAGGSLGTATFSSETASGWQQVNFATPIAVSANTTYVASYHTKVGHYSVNEHYFTTGVDNAPLHALANGVNGSNGVYAYGARSSFPANTYLARNYWVDVVFSTSLQVRERVPDALAG